jgi:threonine synthase
VCIATAHPAKFPDAVKRALPEVDSRHPTLDALVDKAERKVVIEPTLEAVKALFD